MMQQVINPEGLMSNFFHAGITVPDLEEAKRFFVNVFNLQIVSERFLHGPYLANMLAYRGELTARIVLLRVDENVMLELVEYRNQDGSLPEPGIRQDITRSGTPHLAFFVDDLDKFDERNSGRTLHPLAESHDVIPRGPLAGGKIRFYRAKFECLIEVIQRPSSFNV
jgi:catechol 2,3-dioxygenase-like lactoylglutathione lyase family enzyme